MSAGLKRLSVLHKNSMNWGWNESIRKYNPLICPRSWGGCWQNSPEIESRSEEASLICGETSLCLLFFSALTFESPNYHCGLSPHISQDILDCVSAPWRGWRYLPLWILIMLQWHQLELGMGLSRQQHSGRVRDPSPGICPSDRAVQEPHLHREGAVLKATLDRF